MGQKFCSFSWKRALSRLAQAVVNIFIGQKLEYFTYYYFIATEKQYIIEVMVRDWLLINKGSFAGSYLNAKVHIDTAWGSPAYSEDCKKCACTDTHIHIFAIVHTSIHINV